MDRDLMRYMTPSERQRYRRLFTSGDIGTAPVPRQRTHRERLNVKRPRKQASVLPASWALPHLDKPPCQECGWPIVRTAAARGPWPKFCDTACKELAQQRERDSRAEQRQQARVAATAAREAEARAQAQTQAGAQAVRAQMAAEQWAAAQFAGRWKLSEETLAATLARIARAYQAPVRRAGVSHFVPYLMERDRGRCQIIACTFADRRIRAKTGPGRPSADHIVPWSTWTVADGPDPDVLENLQLAHLRCNVAKGNRHAGQVLLFG